MTDTKKREILQDSSGGSESASAEVQPNEHTANEPDDENSHKRPKRATWLHFTGKRHTRVGDDYQVTILPVCDAATTTTTSAATNGTTGETGVAESAVQENHNNSTVDQASE